MEETNGYYGIRYEELIPFRIKAIQEIYKRIMKRKGKHGDKGKRPAKGNGITE